MLPPDDFRGYQGARAETVLSLFESMNIIKKDLFFKKDIFIGIIAGRVVNSSG